MASTSSPSFLFPASAEKKRDDPKPIENPLLSRNSLTRYSPQQTRRSPTATALVPLSQNNNTNNSSEGLRHRRPEKNSSGFIAPPRASVDSLGAGLDSLKQVGSSSSTALTVATTATTTSPTAQPLTLVSSHHIPSPRRTSTPGCWVLVYGYTSQAQYDEILRRFSSFGHVLDHHGSYALGQSNWIAIRYESRLEAEKALCHQHMRLVDDIFCGVKRLQDNDPILLQAQGSLDSLWNSQNKKDAVRGGDDKRFAAPDSQGWGTTSSLPRVVNANTNSLEEREILLSPNHPAVSAGRRRRGVCEEMARWIFAIDDL
jgi:hypothetical protein